MYLPKTRHDSPIAFERDSSDGDCRYADRIQLAMSSSIQATALAEVEVGVEAHLNVPAARWSTWTRSSFTNGRKPEQLERSPCSSASAPSIVP